MSASVAGIGSALPPAAGQRDLWDKVFSERFAAAPRAAAIWRAVGVSQRGRVADPRQEDLASWGTEARMRRFVEEGAPLGKEAVASALHGAGISAEEVDLLTVVSCTGYASPGLDVLIARDLGMRADAERLHVGHMGCHAAIPAIASATDTARARGRTAVVLCVELPSLHVQPATDDPEQVLVHALFADAAAACVVSPSLPGLEVVDTASVTDVREAAMMTWDVTDHGFRMGLASEVPDILARSVRPAIQSLLVRNRLSIDDVGTWAVHPGGPRILEVVADRLGLDPAALRGSRETLRAHGNASSATILLILERLLAQETPDAGEHLVAMAFGPGLTLAALLLRRTA